MFTDQQPPKESGYPALKPLVDNLTAGYNNRELNIANTATKNLNNFFLSAENSINGDMNEYKITQDEAIEKIIKLDHFRSININDIIMPKDFGSYDPGNFNVQHSISMLKSFGVVAQESPNFGQFYEKEKITESFIDRLKSDGKVVEDKVVGVDGRYNQRRTEVITNIPGLNMLICSAGEPESFSKQYRSPSINNLKLVPSADFYKSAIASNK